MQNFYSLLKQGIQENIQKQQLQDQYKYSINEMKYNSPMLISSIFLAQERV